MLFFGNQIVVLATEGYDLDGGFLICHAADAIAVQAGAVDQVAGAEFTFGGFDDALIRVADDAGDFGCSADFPALCSYELSVLLADTAVVGDAGAGDEQPCDTAAVRLELQQFFALQHSQAGDSVGLAALHEGLQAGDLGVADGDDDFAGDLVGKVMFAAESHHGGCAFYAQLGFQRSGFVVNTGVDDATVVAALVAGDAVLFLKQ